MRRSRRFAGVFCEQANDLGLLLTHGPSQKKRKSAPGRRKRGLLLFPQSSNRRPGFPKQLNLPETRRGDIEQWLTGIADREFKRSRSSLPLPSVPQNNFQPFRSHRLTQQIARPKLKLAAVLIPPLLNKRRLRPREVI